MPNRVLKDQNYRFGFNGKEADREGQWGSTEHYDYGFRIYDPKLGRFLSVDPLTSSYPWYTPYQFAGNMPIWAIDVDGLEPYKTTDNTGYTYNDSSIKDYEAPSHSRYSSSSLSKRAELLSTNNSIGRGIVASERAGSYSEISGGLNVSEFSVNSTYTNDIGGFALGSIGGSLTLPFALGIIGREGAINLGINLAAQGTVQTGISAYLNYRYGTEFSLESIASRIDWADASLSIGGGTWAGVVGSAFFDYNYSFSTGVGQFNYFDFGVSGKKTIGAFLVDLSVNAIFKGVGDYTHIGLANYYHSKATDASQLYTIYHAGTLIHSSGSPMFNNYFNGAIKQYGLMSKYLDKADMFGRTPFTGTFQSDYLFTTGAEGTQNTIKNKYGY